MFVRGLYSESLPVLCCELTESFFGVMTGEAKYLSTNQYLPEVPAAVGSKYTGSALWLVWFYNKADLQYRQGREGSCIRSSDPDFVVTHAWLGAMCGCLSSCSPL